MERRWQWMVLLVTRQMWLRVSLIAFAGVATAAAGIILAPYVPDSLTWTIGADAIDGMLNVLASSMLAVTVFSMSTMVSAFSAAAQNVSPRATQLLMADRTSQNVLGTFVGSFLFSLVGIIALGTGLYGSHGRAILLIATVLLVFLIAITILRWIDYLAKFGRLSETITRVEQAASQALGDRALNPFLGGIRLVQLPDRRRAVFSGKIGYVQHIDMAALDEAGASCSAEIFVNALPGTFADPARPLAFVSPDADQQIDEAVAAAFTVGTERTFDQDPRFGLCVLAEIGSRALSSAVNDAGTAIDVIGRGVRLLATWMTDAAKHETYDVLYGRVHVPQIHSADLLDDLFAPIARDGAGLVEVQLRLQKGLLALMALADSDMRRHLQRHAAESSERAEAALGLESERQAIRAAAGKVMSSPAVAAIFPRV